MSCTVDEKYINEFKSNGFTIIPGFLSLDEVAELKEATRDVIDKYCQNITAIFCGKDADGILTEYTRNDYFAESGDKIRGFLEESAVNEKHEPVVPVSEGLNKIGHALHKFHPVFNKHTINDKVKTIVQTLTSIQKPTIIQSMVIFKNPKVGGIVRPHQDSSFLYVEPKEGSLLGFWIALDEATKENGCLHFWPGSHLNGVLHERMIRNPDPSANQLFIFEGKKVPAIPEDKSVPAQAKPGDLVLIDGLVIHESAPNTSAKPRLAYTFHVLDGAKKYSEQNWNQPTEAGTFMTF